MDADDAGFVNPSTDDEAEDERSAEEEEKTYEIWRSLKVQVQSFFDSGGGRKQQRVHANNVGKKLSALVRGLPQSKETGVVCCALGVETNYRVLYTALENGLILRWRYKGGKIDLAGALNGHKGMVLSLLTYKLDRSSLPYLVFSGSADSTIKIWDPKSNQRIREGFITDGVCVQSLVGHGGTVTTVTQVHKYILSGSTDCTVRIWHKAKNREALLYPWFEQLRVLSAWDGWVKSLSFSKTDNVGDSGDLWVADADGCMHEFTLCVVKDKEDVSWTFESQQHKRRDTLLHQSVRDRAIIQIQYEAEENLLISLAFDFRLRVYNTKYGTCLHVIENPNGCAFNSFHYDRAHQDILVADAHGYLMIYDLGTGKMTVTQRITSKPLKSLRYCPDTSTVVLASEADVEFWKVNRDTDYKIVSSGHNGPVISILSCRASSNLPFALQKMQHNHRIFSASLDNTIRMWDPYDMCCTRVLNEDRSELSTIACLAKSNQIVSGHDDGSLRLWNLDTGSTTNLREHTNTVTCLAIATFKGKDEELVLSGSYDGFIGVWDMRRQPNKGIRPHMLSMFQASANAEILCLIHDCVKNVIISSGNDTCIRVWSEGAYELLGTHEGHAEAVTSLALDANFLFSGSEDCSIKVWDTVPVTSRANSQSAQAFKAFKGDTTLIKTLKGHDKTVTDLEIVPSHGHLLSCSQDGIFNIWNYTQGVILKQFKHHEDFRCLALRSDKNEVLIGTEQEKILRFPLGDLDKLEAPPPAELGEEGGGEGKGNASQGGEREGDASQDEKEDGTAK